MIKLKRKLGEKGQIVIPKDIRNQLNLKPGENVVFEMKENEIIIKTEDGVDEFLHDLFSVARTNKKDLTLEDIKRIEEESYDLP
jgi:AbrB family looped-hinge helix DNA binding protein